MYVYTHHNAMVPWDEKGQNGFVEVNDKYYITYTLHDMAHWNTCSFVILANMIL